MPSSTESVLRPPRARWAPGASETAVGEKGSGSDAAAPPLAGRPAPRRVRSRPAGAPAVAACPHTSGTRMRPLPAGHTTLFLALFLLLAGLFAVLLSHSRIDRPRAVRVLASLGNSFAAAPFPPPAPEAERAGGWRRTGAPEIPAASGGPLPARSSPPGPVVVTLPEQRLFTAAGEVPRARWLTLGRLARLARDAGGRLEIAAPWPRDAAARRLRALRLRALAATVRQLGAPRERLALGFASESGTAWRLVYRPATDPDPMWR